MYPINPRSLTLLGVLVLVQFCAIGQQLNDNSWQTIALDNLNTFEKPSANWGLASEVTADRNKKLDLKVTAGSGILVNQPTEAAKGNLLTNFTHGDIDLELEVMVPKGSNSGIYLMGRYELQLFDSYGQSQPAHSDMGGIYQRWNEKAPTQPYDQRGYEGKAPRCNACYAPGLWQKLSINFRAPRFDANGRKVENARFLRVTLNNVVVQQEAELTGPTRGAISNEEVARAPILIQGDHGPVAFRNIRYIQFDAPAPTWKALSYQLWYGGFKTIDQFVNSKPAKTGSLNNLTWAVSDQADKFAIRYTGVIHVGTADTVTMHLNYDHKLQLKVNGQMVRDTGASKRWWNSVWNKVYLNAGDNPVELIYFKDNEKTKPGLGFRIEATGMRSAILSEPNSLPESAPNPNYYLEVGSKPKLQRVFAKYKDKLYPYSIAVGDPSGMHYLYNLNAGSVYRVWKGHFANMQGLWNSRGSDQVMYPLGGYQELSGSPTVAKLASSEAAWPDTLMEVDFRHQRYKVSKAGLPTFEHMSQGISYVDQISPMLGQQGLTRKLTVTNGESGYVKVAEGKTITSTATGSYLVRNPDHYIELSQSEGKTAEKPILRTTNGMQQLLMPISKDKPVSYQIIW